MEDWKKKKNVATIATVPLGTVATFQNLKKKEDKVANQNGTVKKVVWTVQKYCRKKSTNRWLGKNKNKKQWIVHIEQSKNIVAFTYSPNKCHNIFTKHLFSVVVGYSFIFYYFILTYKKL